MLSVRDTAKAATAAKGAVAAASGADKNRLLEELAQSLERDCPELLRANLKDIQSARAAGLSAAFIERLTLNEGRVDSMVKSLLELARMEDPVGQIISGSTRPNGLKITKKRVPIGVVAVIYESRPNVTVDAAALCLKAGNSVVLRGGKEAINSNKKLVEIIRSTLRRQGLPEDCVCLIEDTDRKSARELMNQVGLVDLLIPRGGRGLIESVVREARVPVIETGAGNCHVYIDEFADLEMGYNIIENAKMSRPSVCNAAETLLVHAAVAAEFLPRLERRLAASCELRGCPITRSYIPAAEATEEDFETEYNDYILAIKVGSSLEEAIDHINRYGTRHSEAIVTESITNANRFMDGVDAAAVYLNASTRFTDGGEFGMGAEIGISTSKLHARGPMGLEALTTTKYTIFGSGQVR